MYIDPNTGGMLFQILAVVLGIFSGIILLFSGKIRMAFAKMRRHMRGEAKPDANENSSGDENLPPAA